jgi:hypothetical protein
MEEVNKNAELNDTDKKLHISDVMYSFSDMINFNKWLLDITDYGVEDRYVFSKIRNVWVDDFGEEFTWSEMYQLYQKNCT